MKEPTPLHQSLTKIKTDSFTPESRHAYAMMRIRERILAAKEAMLKAPIDCQGLMGFPYDEKTGAVMNLCKTLMNALEDLSE